MSAETCAWSKKGSYWMSQCAFFISTASMSDKAVHYAQFCLFCGRRIILPKP
jgi:hypothetical protein